MTSRDPLTMEEVSRMLGYPPTPQRESEFEFWRRQAAERAKEGVRLRGEIVTLRCLLDSAYEVLGARDGLTLEEAVELVQEQYDATDWGE